MVQYVMVPYVMVGVPHRRVKTHQHSLTLRLQWSVVAAQNKRQTNTPTHIALIQYCLSEFMSSIKRSQASAPTVEDFINEGKEVQNRSGRNLATDQTEDRIFGEFFGCGAPIALQLWNLLDENGCSPESGQICHLLWTLFFMKQYPTE